MNRRAVKAYTVAQLCEAFQVSKPTMLRTIRDEGWPILPFGRAIRVPAAFIDDMLNRACASAGAA